MQCRVEHTWPTRKDPFADDWCFVEQMLEDTQATLEAKTIFEYLQRAYPGKYHNGQLRTLQHRIKPESEKIRICNIRNFAPMGRPQETLVHGIAVITEGKK